VDYKAKEGERHLAVRKEKGEKESPGQSSKVLSSALSRERRKKGEEKGGEKKDEIS